MKNLSLAVAAATALLTLAGAAAAKTGAERQILLSVDFEPRAVDLIEIGDFHFQPGQKGPTHTHAAPVFGYVSKGTIYYQVEGQAAQILKTGDAFFEPAGPRILHFDNASDTQEAIFTDFNLQRDGEPFISFEKPLTEEIDRRAFPTLSLEGRRVAAVEAYAETIEAGVRDVGAAAEPVVVYVAEGAVRVRIGAAAPIDVAEGRTFFRPAGAAMEIRAPERARLIAFHLR